MDGHVDKRASSLFTPTPGSKMLGTYSNWIYKKFFLKVYLNKLIILVNMIILKEYDNIITKLG